jgi:ABC-type transport system, involved in lipoprotein release, permease component
MDYLFRLIFRNVFRHPLRTGLTMVGIVVAITAFGLLRTVVSAWYAGAEATSATRLVTRNAISLTFPLPISYLHKIRRISGVASVSYASWFGGVYISEKNFFAQFAVEPRSYFNLYPELILAPEQMKAFLRDRRGAVSGRKLANQYGWKIGDVIPIRGTIYPGNWSFVLRGLYVGADKKTDERQFFFHWDYLNESQRKTAGRPGDQVGIYLIGLDHAEEAAAVSNEIDHAFKNSLAETLTETEKAFQLEFISMTEAILVVIQSMSFIVIIILMTVMANTMAMTVRERGREYATLKALGFGARYIAALIFGESLLITLTAGSAGIILTYPVADFFAGKMETLFPVFNVADETAWMALAAASLVGLVAAVLPTWRAVTAPILEGLGSLG